MGALEKFLDEHDYDFDLASVIARDAEQMDSACPPPSIYKYFASSRRGFFRDPVIRFTQKTSLNDPFELTTRWHEFAGPPVRKLFADAIQKKLARLTENKGLVLQMVKEELAQKGIFVGPDQMAQAAQGLLSPQGDEWYQNLMKNALEQIEPFTHIAFDVMDARAEQAFEETTSKLGIFSVAENPINDQMWGLYASSGTGFVIELDTQHDFFRAPIGGNLLRKVRYTNEKVRDFWHNPLYLFLVKNEDWRFEEEWRMIKKLTDCDEVRVYDKQEIYLCRVRPGMIRSVIFGYNYDLVNLPLDGASVRSFDPDIRIQIAVANRSSGEIELRELL